MSYFAHDSAYIEECQIGENTKIWHGSQIRSGAKLGKNCILGKNVFVGADVSIGSNVKIQNNVSVYTGVTLEDGVFVGPHVVFTNDKYPRAVDLKGDLRSVRDWSISETLVKKGASIGANATILPGVVIGEFSMVGSGAVVTKDVEDFSIVLGNPAEPSGFVCKCGNKLGEKKKCQMCNAGLNKNKKVVFR